LVLGDGVSYLSGTEALGVRKGSLRLCRAHAAPWAPLVAAIGGDSALLNLAATGGSGGGMVQGSKGVLLGTMILEASMRELAPLNTLESGSSLLAEDVACLADGFVGCDGFASYDGFAGCDGFVGCADFRPPEGFLEATSRLFSVAVEANVAELTLCIFRCE
jgi:hypothetical protein